MGETKVYKVLAEAEDLCNKIKKYEKEADQELVINWIYDTLKVVNKLGKAVEELEERFELLEDSLEK
ncbi:MAG: hypothetical protein ACP5C3_04175 [Methanomicrobiales archaeon]